MNVKDAEELCCPFHKKFDKCVSTECMAWQPTRLVTEKNVGAIYGECPTISYYKNTNTLTERGYTQDTGYCKLIGEN